MIDTVLAFAGSDRPRLVSAFSIRRSEPIFSSGEPPLRWPPLYIVEGLAQCSSLLSVLRSWEAHFAARGVNVDGFRDTFRSPHADDFIGDPWEAMFQEGPNTVDRTGMLASVDVEITGPVSAGDLLRYEVEQTHVVGGLYRFAASAFVGNRTVAKGTLVGARLEGDA